MVSRIRFRTTGNLTVLQADDVLIKSDAEMADAQGLPHYGGLSRFPMGSAGVDLQNLHPAPEQIDVLWDAYVGHFDPLIKILHRPSMEALVSSVKLREPLSPPNEALMFAVYWVGLMSMPEHLVLEVFHLEKAALVANYRWAVEQALLNAELDSTQELATLQAFVLYLATIRRLDETRRAGNLAGMALRIAQCQGLHHDGTRFGLSPFDCEQRRRLWWQLCYLDQRASEDYGAESSAWDLSFDTKPPSNVNDDDLIPGSSQLVESKRGWTDSSFCLVRLEFAKMNRMIRTGLATERKDLPVFLTPGMCRTCSVSGFSQHANLEAKADETKGKRHSFTIAEKEQLISRCHHDIRTQYFTNYDPSDPLQYLAHSVSEMLIAKSRFMLRNPLRPSSARSPSPANPPGTPHHRASQSTNSGAKMPADVKDRQFTLATSILEVSTQLESDPRLDEWRWLIYSYFQYLPLAFILTELCVRPPGSSEVDRAWRVVDASVNNWNDDIRSSQNGLILQRLLVRAQATRERWLGPGAAAGLRVPPADRSPGSHPASPMMKQPFPSPVTTSMSSPLPHPFTILPSQPLGYPQDLPSSQTSTMPAIAARGPFGEAAAPFAFSGPSWNFAGAGGGSPAMSEVMELDEIGISVEDWNNMLNEGGSSAGFWQMSSDSSMFGQPEGGMNWGHG